MSLASENRPTWAEINLENLLFNFSSVKNFIGENLKYMAVVKADAYGHSAVECALKLQSAGIDCFGVAIAEEGLELRIHGVKAPIVCLGGFWAGQEQIFLDNNLTPVIYRLEMAECFNRAAKKRKKVVDVHIKIDTGMGRIGVRFDQVEIFTKGFERFKNLNIQGLMTHFAAADDLKQKIFTQIQIDRFNESVKIFEGKGFKPFYKDLANSPGAIAHANSRSNLVRLGGILYGLGGDVLPKEITKPVLRPVMSLHSRIAQLKNVPKGETLGYSRTFQTEKDSLIATVPIGYYDGYRRALSNCGRVVVNGNYANVVGRISMDWTLIDVTGIADVKVNDEVILIGSQDNSQILSEELALLSDTISYEITCGISKRVRKIFL